MIGETSGKPGPELRMPRETIQRLDPGETVLDLASALTALAEVCRMVDETTRRLLVCSVAAALLPVVAVAPEAERGRA